MTMSKVELWTCTFLTLINNSPGTRKVPLGHRSPTPTPTAILGHLLGSLLLAVEDSALTEAKPLKDTNSHLWLK